MSKTTLITILSISAISGFGIWLLPMDKAIYLSACMVGLTYALGEHNAKK